jgi:hypothetical protein
VLGAAAGKATQVISPAARAARRLANAVEESGGRMLSTRRSRLRRPLGADHEVIAGDLSPATQMLTRFAANNNPNTYVHAAEKLNARQPNMTERLLDDATDLLGENPNATARADELAKSKAAFGASDAGYEGLRNSGVAFDPTEVAPFLKEPSVQSAWKLARRAGDITSGISARRAVPEIECSESRRVAGEDPRGDRIGSDGESHRTVRRSRDHVRRHAPVQAVAR